MTIEDMFRAHVRELMRRSLRRFCSYRVVTPANDPRVAAISSSKLPDGLFPQPPVRPEGRRGPTYAPAASPSTEESR